MSLLERSIAISMEAACPDGDTGDAWSVSALKDRVQERISADRMALLMRESPGRARAEVRSACRAVFSEGWGVGLSATDLADLVDQLLDAIFGLGPLELPLEDETVTEVMVNGTRSLFVEREGKLVEQDNPFTDDAQVRALIDRIIGPLGRRIDESSPMVNARLPQGHRVNAVIPPLALDGSVLTIRKFREKVMTLEEMVQAGSMDERMAQLLAWAVRARKNVAVTGGTGSGKTTLLNALSCKISPSERILTIEDSAELRFFEHPHVVRLEARPRNAEGRGGDDSRPGYERAAHASRPHRGGRVPRRRGARHASGHEHGPRWLAHNAACELTSGGRDAPLDDGPLCRRFANRRGRSADCRRD